jgi:serine/threonine protein kinase
MSPALRPIAAGAHRQPFLVGLVMTENIPLSLSPGTEIAGYQIESLLGRGGMAVVFKARDLRLDRPVALKVLAPELARSPQFRDRFLRESRLAASLDHPNIVPVYEAGEAAGLLFIAMRLVGGGDLTALLQDEGPLSPDETVAILSQVAAALDAAHAAGLVHRDVKPDNILLVPGAGAQHQVHAYLSDFGLTKRVTSLSGVTTHGEFVATMDYAAPEQIGSRPIDARTDVYGLGCVAYRCLTGTVPLVRDDEAALLWAHLVQRPPPMSTHRSELAPLDAVVARALEKNPDDRYATCGQFVDALTGVLHVPAAADPPDPLPSPDAPTNIRKAAPATPPGGLHAPASVAAADPTDPLPSPDAPTNIRKAAPATPPAVPTPVVAPPVDQPEHRPDGGGPDSVPAQTGNGPPRPARWRSRRLTALVAALVTLAVAAFFIARTGSNTPRTTSSNTAAAAAAATSQCRSALAAADQTLNYGAKMATQIRAHAGIMKSMPQMISMGRSSLIAGAAAAAKYEYRLAAYGPLSEKCVSNRALIPACKARVAAANQALGHASNVETALNQHTAIMTRWDSGQLTTDQAHHLGRPSQDTGLTEAAALDQSTRNYRQPTVTC